MVPLPDTAAERVRQQRIVSVSARAQPGHLLTGRARALLARYRDRPLVAARRLAASHLRTLLHSTIAPLGGSRRGAGALPALPHLRTLGPMYQTALGRPVTGNGSLARTTALAAAERRVAALA